MMGSFLATAFVGYYATHLVPVHHFPPLVKIGYAFLGALPYMTAPPRQPVLPRVFCALACSGTEQLRPTQLLVSCPLPPKCHSASCVGGAIRTHPEPSSSHPLMHPRTSACIRPQRSSRPSCPSSSCSAPITPTPDSTRHGCGGDSNDTTLPRPQPTEQMTRSPLCRMRPTADTPVFVCGRRGPS